MFEEHPAPFVFRYFLVLFLLSILLVGRILWPFLAILVLSLLLTGIFQPVYDFFNRKLPRNIASLCTCFIIIVLVFMPLVFFVGALSKEAFEMYQFGKATNINIKMQELLQESTVLVRFQDVMTDFGYELKPELVGQELANIAKEVGWYLFNQASGWAANIMNFVFDFFMMILVIFFLLMDKDRLVEYLVRLSPLPDDQERRLIRKFNDIAGAVLVGNGVCGLIQGVFGGVAFIFFGFGSPILWGGLMGLLAFLPIFGIGLVLVPASLILLLQGKVVSGIMLFVFYILLSFSIEYLVKPKMVGERVEMHTLLVFLSILGGLSVFGFLGIIYGPLIVTAFLTLADIYLKNYDFLVKKPSGEVS